MQNETSIFSLLQIECTHGDSETNMALDTEDCAEVLLLWQRQLSTPAAAHCCWCRCRQTSVPLHVRDTNQFSTRKTLTANKRGVTSFHHPKLSHFSVWNMLHTSVLDWALYPSRFRQYLSFLHQQQKHFESYNLNWKGFIRTQYKIKFWSFYNCKFK